MKKLFMILAVIILTYIAIAGILTATGVCPKYINLMPRPVAEGTENTKSPNDPQSWHFLCPFAEKVY